MLLVTFISFVVSSSALVNPGTSWNVPHISLPDFLGAQLNKKQFEWDLWHYTGVVTDSDFINYSLEIAIGRKASNASLLRDDIIGYVGTPVPKLPARTSRMFPIRPIKKIKNKFKTNLTGVGSTSYANPFSLFVNQGKGYSCTLSK